ELLERARAFLGESRQARAGLAARGPTLSFLHHYVRQFLTAHPSVRDRRALTEFAYGDAALPANAAPLSGTIRYTSDQASALRALSEYYRVSRDAFALEAISGLAESSLQALTASGAVRSKRFDQLAVSAENDTANAR